MTVAIPVGEVPRSVPFDFFGRIPASIWRRTDISARAKVVLGGLACIARGSAGRVRATYRQVAEAAGVSTKTVSRAVRELVSAGIVLWEAIGSNFVFQFYLKGQEGAILGPLPGQEGVDNVVHRQGTILSMPSGQRCPPAGNPPNNPLMEDREKESSEGATDTFSSGLPGKPATEAEFLEDLFRRAQATVEQPIPHAAFAAALDQYGDLTVEHAIDKVERLGLKGSWAYYAPVLAELERLERPVPMQNLNPPTKIEPATSEDFADPVDLAATCELIRQGGAGVPALLRMLRAAVARGVLEPGGLDRDVRDLVLGSEKKADRGTSLVTTPTAGRAFDRSDTIVHAAPDESNTTCKNGNLSDQERCARQDSNLQPSDSKSAACEPRKQPERSRSAAPNRTPPPVIHAKPTDIQSAGSPCVRLSRLPFHEPTEHQRE